MQRYIGKEGIIEGRGEVIYAVLEHVIRVTLCGVTVGSCYLIASENVTKKQNQRKSIFKQQLAFDEHISLLGIEHIWM